MKKMKIKILNHTHCMDVQEMLFKLGYVWFGDDIKTPKFLESGFLFTETDGTLGRSDCPSYFNDCEEDEETLESLTKEVRNKEQSWGFISGEEAIEKLEDAQVALDPNNGHYTWQNIKDCEYPIKHLLNELHETKYLKHRLVFRLKPRTIKVELEIPVPFEPKDREEAWCLDGSMISGYKKIKCDNFIDSGIGFWRTEEEIKQVVAALRGGIKG